MGLCHSALVRRGGCLPEGEDMLRKVCCGAASESILVFVSFDDGLFEGNSHH